MNTKWRQARRLSYALVLAAFVWGCAHLQPGADPIVVRAEQTEQVAKATFQLALRTDQLDRGFWRTNAPAFHNYCVWLRAPSDYGASTLPRYRVLLLSVDDLKLDYKQARATSNALFIAIISLRSASDQAGLWLNVITNKVKLGTP